MSNHENSLTRAGNGPTSANENQVVGTATILGSDRDTCTSQAVPALHSIWTKRDGHKAPILFLHSLGTDHRIWRHQVEAITDRTVGLMDARGHGQSTGFDTVSVAEWVEDICKVLDQAGMEQVILCGVSMGGVQALAFANTYPNRVKALVLADTFMVMPSEIQPAKIEGTAGRAKEVGMDTYADVYLDNTLTDRDTAMWARPELREAIAGMSLKMYAASAEACFTAQVQPQFSGIPALVLIGEKDFKTPIEMSETIVSAIPGAQFAKVAGAAHLSNVDNPVDFNRHLTAFLEGVDTL